MEDIIWKKDETPYLIFSCRKCHNYIYAKSTQKTKKCIRCGYIHKVNNVIERSEIIKGISNAIELVKKKQNELAIKELGSEPVFRTSEDFRVVGREKSQKDAINIDFNDYNYSEKLKQMLYNLSKAYNTFPYYIIEIMAENYNIPKSEVKLLTRKLKKQGVLKRINGDYYYKLKV
ncbi:MAG: DUF1922 domain-containing protein [Promethearchaeota archaeon]